MNKLDKIKEIIDRQLKRSAARERERAVNTKFKIGKWYKTTDNQIVEFVKPIEKDGMYNVFRCSKELGYRPYYTDINGKTLYGSHIILIG